MKLNKLKAAMVIAGVTDAQMDAIGGSFENLLTVHEDALVKALASAKAGDNVFHIMLMTLEKESGISISIQVGKTTSEAGKAFAESLGIDTAKSTKGFNYKKAAVIGGTVVVVAGVSYGGYRYYKSRKAA